MDTITQTFTDLATGTLQPIFWLIIAITAVTVALLLGMATPLALRIEEARYRFSMRNEQREDVTATVTVSAAAERQLQAGNGGTVRSLHGATRAGDRTRGSGVCVQ